MTAPISVAEYRALQKKRPKYGNKKCIVDSYAFDSRAEACRYIDLKLLEKAGKISGLLLQPEFDLHVCGVLVCRYVGDFEYVENGKRVIEDVKGVKTAVYRLKKKLVKAILGIEIMEIT